jgi:hypothetical protein
VRLAHVTESKVILYASELITATIMWNTKWSSR